MASLLANPCAKLLRLDSVLMKMWGVPYLKLGRAGLWAVEVQVAKNDKKASAALHSLLRQCVPLQCNCGLSGLIQNMDIATVINGKAVRLLKIDPLLTSLVNRTRNEVRQCNTSYHRLHVHATNPCLETNGSEMAESGFCRCLPQQISARCPHSQIVWHVTHVSVA